MPFNLQMTEEQGLMVESIDRFAQNLRDQAQQAETEQKPASEVQASAAELGLALLSVPQDMGGVGEARSPLSTALYTESMAKGDMGQALALMAPVGLVNLLVDLGAKEQLKEIIQRLEKGFVPAAVALVEPGFGFDALKPKTRIRSEGNAFVVSGEKSAVPWACEAEYLAVVAVDEDEQARVAIIRAHGNPEGLSRTPAPAMGLRAAALGNLVMESVRVLAEDVFPLDIRNLVALSRLGQSALAAGACQAVVDYVIPYCNERTAFGESISNRQSVAFAIADMATELEAMRLLLWKAAARADCGEEFRALALQARTFAAEYSMQIGTDGVQLLGGHGYVKEHPVERWYRDLRATGALDALLPL